MNSPTPGITVKLYTYLTVTFSTNGFVPSVPPPARGGLAKHGAKGALSIRIEDGARERVRKRNASKKRFLEPDHYGQARLEKEICLSQLDN